MNFYDQRISLPEYPYGKPGVSLPEMTEAPEPLGYLIREVFDDLAPSKSQLREQVTDLEARNQELEEYAHTVAHDLKIPLTVLIMTADMIKDVPDLSGEESKECLQQIKSIAYEMNSIIDNLLLFAEVSKAEAPRESVHMDRVVANVQTRLSCMIRKQGAQLILPQVWPDALGYGPWIEEVWANYLSNALKYGGQAGRPACVELGASVLPDGMIRFWTRDSGPGIPPEVRDRLFRPFSLLGCVPNQGHGLGLSIMQHIVEKLGGQVGVESAVGEGSLFFFTLPAAAPYS